ncbi:hypothetical protein [Pantoea phage Nufs112]|nr:hypothetical protein [Pantoea phage Nufs112]
MRLIMLLGAAHGIVVGSEEIPLEFRVAKRVEVSSTWVHDELPVKCDKLYYEYVLVAHGPEEAYYVPRGFSKLQVIKGLLEAQ